jgi:hypothetical protein
MNALIVRFGEPMLRCRKPFRIVRKAPMAPLARKLIGMEKPPLDAAASHLRFVSSY